MSVGKKTSSVGNCFRRLRFYFCRLEKKVLSVGKNIYQLEKNVRCNNKFSVRNLFCRLILFLVGRRKNFCWLEKKLVVWQEKLFVGKKNLSVGEKNCRLEKLFCRLSFFLVRGRKLFFRLEKVFVG